VEEYLVNSLSKRIGQAISQGPSLGRAYSAQRG
jgi:hypothetical protein